MFTMRALLNVMNKAKWVLLVGLLAANVYVIGLAVSTPRVVQATSTSVSTSSSSSIATASNTTYIINDRIPSELIYTLDVVEDPYDCKKFLSLVKYDCTIRLDVIGKYMSMPLPHFQRWIFYDGKLYVIHFRKTK